MRTTGKLLTLLLSGVLAQGALGCATQEGDDTQSCEGKCDGVNVTWSDQIPNIVPEEVHAYLEKYQWGDYHMIFHSSRRYFIGGARTRAWLDGLHEQYADLQEGDPRGGLEFLAMHRAMIEHLNEKFGDTAVPSAIKDGAGFDTMGEVLTGWDTNAKVIAMLEERGGDVELFNTAAAKIQDWDSWASEDQFGEYVQTTLRLSRMVDENDTELRFYDKDSTPGAGIHNSLHGMFSDGSEVDVGDPQTNLSNQMFWGIHGWVEAQWEEFERHHTRTVQEQEEFDYQLDRFRLHMQLHSDFHEEHQTQLPKPPPAVVDEIKAGNKAFANGADCADLDETVVMPDCTP